MHKKSGYFWNPDDHLSSPWVEICDLTDEGIYRRLLDFQWKSPGCQLPDDIPYLRRLCKNARAERIKKILEINFAKIETENGIFFWRNNRLYTEFSAQLNKSLKAFESVKHRKTRPIKTNDCKTIAENAIEQVKVSTLKRLIKPQSNDSRPTLEQIKEYCRERKNTVDPDRFFNFYESNGWKVGKNPMRNWKAAIRTWERGDATNANRNRSFFERDVEQSERAKQGARTLLGIHRRGDGLAPDIHPQQTDRKREGAVSGEIIVVPPLETDTTR